MTVPMTTAVTRLPVERIVSDDLSDSRYLDGRPPSTMTLMDPAPIDLIDLNAPVTLNIPFSTILATLCIEILTVMNG